MAKAQQGSLALFCTERMQQTTQTEESAFY